MNGVLPVDGMDALYSVWQIWLAEASAIDADPRLDGAAKASASTELDRAMSRVQWALRDMMWPASAPHDTDARVRPAGYGADGTAPAVPKEARA